LPESAAPRNFFGLVFMHPIYHGQNRNVPLLMRNSII
jgi:hypothetical protein